MVRIPTKAKKIIKQKVDKKSTKSTKSIPKTGAGNGEIRIVVLNRGWIGIGRYFQKGMNCRLENAHTIRRWGTPEKGLGQLAIEGKQKETVLDRSTIEYFHVLVVIKSIACDYSLWDDILV